MATLANFGVPGVTTGILHPKMSYRFGVYFRCQTQADEGVAQAALSTLTTQVVSCNLPTRRCSGVHPGNGPVRGFKLKAAGIEPNSGLIIRFQEDMMNRLISSINFVEEHANKLEVIVAQLDGDDHVVYAHVFGGVQLKTITHSQLNYGQGTGGSITGTLKNGEEIAQLNCSIRADTDATLMIDAMFMPMFWQHGVVNVTLKEFLEKL